ncbi:bacitracin ABC transporter permease [Bacillus manliponensis]|uniref:Bacitracin ABC transporter permease n=1 Tax=Bacillus manliponensis TaxID=574376 RepID=A0A073K050_9BACI|nr:undecaprenyl-diphosphatase [Bacillus manliponensis]KEK19886.1 bacitracin ABC transporter permease [Bacillus manliponensis]
MSFFQFNVDAFRFINDFGKQYSFLNPVMIFIAEYTIYVLAFTIFVYWCTRSNKNRMMIIHALLAFILAELIGKVVGRFYSNYQPFAVLNDVNKLIDHEIDNSFPSDHTILFFSISFFFLLVRKRVGLIWFVLAICVAISRVFVGVHYPFDVLVGAVIGIGSAIFVFKITPKLLFLQKLLYLYEKGESYILPWKDKSKSYER